MDHVYLKHICISHIVVDTIGWHVDQMWVNIWGNTGLTYQLCISGHFDQHQPHLDWHAHQTRLYQHMTNTLQTLSWHLADTWSTLGWHFCHSVGYCYWALSSLLALQNSSFVSPLHNGKGVRNGYHSRKTTVKNTHIPPTVHQYSAACSPDMLPIVDRSVTVKVWPSVDHHANPVSTNCSKGARVYLVE